MRSTKSAPPPPTSSPSPERHAFFNDTNPVNYNKTYANETWEKTINFFQKNLP